jgi:hypothetical protein
MLKDFINELSEVLQPYKVWVGQFVTLLSLAQMLSPLFVFNDMRKAKSTKGIPIIMFLLMPML